MVQLFHTAEDLSNDLYLIPLDTVHRSIAMPRWKTGCVDDHRSSLGSPAFDGDTKIVKFNMARRTGRCFPVYSPLSVEIFLHNGHKLTPPRVWQERLANKTDKSPILTLLRYLVVADSKLCAARGRMKYNSNDNKLYLQNHIFAKIIAKVNLIYVAGCF